MQKETEEDFAKVYRPASAPLIRRTLLVPGTWLEDEVVLQLFHFMAWRRRYTRRHVALIDPLVLCAMAKGDVAHHARALTAQFTDGTPLLLLPLVCGSHWSLLMCRTATNTWYHADSLQPYHARLAHDTLQRLRFIEGVVLDPYASVTAVAVPRQRGGWECGLYTLQYMLAAIEASRKAKTTEHRFAVLLTKYCRLACDANLPLFTQRLLEEV